MFSLSISLNGNQNTNLKYQWQIHGCSLEAVEKYFEGHLDSCIAEFEKITDHLRNEGVNIIEPENYDLKTAFYELRRADIEGIKRLLSYEKETDRLRLEEEQRNPSSIKSFYEVINLNVQYNLERGTIIGIKTADEVWEELRKIFPNNEADRYNWLLASTSVVRSDFNDLTKIERCLRRKLDDPIVDYDVLNVEDFEFLPVLLIQPSRGYLFYGDVLVSTLEEVVWLRKVITTSIEQIIESQYENLEIGETNRNEGKLTMEQEKYNSKSESNFSIHHAVFDLNKHQEFNQSNAIRVKADDEVWEALKRMFPNDKADYLNWLLGSTGGIHGDYQDLTEIENRLKRPSKYLIGDFDAFTVLVIQPRICVLHFGTIIVRTLEEVTWLRKVITTSIEEITASQKKNVEKLDIPDGYF